jgi:predicted signal transduction protein with EAL and GGDEF domain
MTRDFRINIAQGLLLAALMLAGAFALKHTNLNPDLSHRLLGILIGVPALVYANAASKTVPPLTRMRCDPAAEQALRRFIAWTLSLGAAAYMTAWALVALPYASTIATTLLGSAVLLVIVRITWTKWRRSQV